MAMSFFQLGLVVVFVGLTSAKYHDALMISVCQLPKDSGLCDGDFPRYYFNSRACLCEKFVYGGCAGNANRFNTLEDCRRRCGGGDLCSLPQVVGPCRAAFPRWWYNKRTNKCQRFTYGGCRGNANNFETLEECRFQCRRGWVY